MKFAPLLLAASWLLAEPSLAQQDQDAKLLELEIQIEQLTRRVEALEAQVGADSGPGVRTDKDLTWNFAPYLAGSPFAVSQQELDRKTGRVDLLLNLMAEPMDLDLWRLAQVGGPVPLAVTASLSDGRTLGPLPLNLHRRTNLDIGTHVHVLVQLPVDDPKLIRRLFIEHTAPH